MNTIATGNIWQIQSRLDIEFLNRKYSALTPGERIRELHHDFKKVLFTSSFGTTSVLLLDLMHKAGVKPSIYFINTTFHFKETIDYKNILQKRYDFDIIELVPERKENEFSQIAELYKYDPDRCCSINKVAPLEKVKYEYDIWVSGLMNWQSTERENLNIFEERKGMLKFYPLIDIPEEDAWQYIYENELPVHPLKPLGYESIGCKHCTIKGEKRNGRWAQSVKTECGLHQ